MTRTLTFTLLAFFVSALLVPALVSTKVQAATLCYSDVECDSYAGYTCKEIGTKAGGMGVCKKPGEAVGLFDNPLQAESLAELLMTVFRGVVRVMTILLVPAFVFVGFQFAAAQGKPESISKARMNLMWTVIGAAILLGAEGIAAVIDATARSLAP